MFWIIVIILCAIVAASLDSTLGKIAIGAAVTAVGFLLLSWITDIDFLITLSKVCAVVIVVVIVGAILLAIGK